jgi:hypothetical protein
MKIEVVDAALPSEMASEVLQRAKNELDGTGRLPPVLFLRARGVPMPIGLGFGSEWNSPEGREIAMISARMTADANPEIVEVVLATDLSRYKCTDDEGARAAGLDTRQPITWSLEQREKWTERTAAIALVVETRESATLIYQNYSRPPRGPVVWRDVDVYDLTDNAPAGLHCGILYRKGGD